MSIVDVNAGDHGKIAQVFKSSIFPFYFDKVEGY